MLRPVLAILLLLLSTACTDEDTPQGAPGGKVSSAAQNFLGFAKGESVGSSGGPDLPSPAVRYTLARNVLVPGDRPVRRLEIEVPLRVEAGELEATLREASRRPDLGEGALLQIWAHPDKLRHLCGACGLLTVARDGKGVPRTDGQNESLLIEAHLGAELDLNETRAVFSMDAAAGAGQKEAGVVAAGVAAGLTEEQAEALLEKFEEHYPPAPESAK